MITPQKIQDISDPIESVYIHMVDDLLINIGRHITSPNWTHTASWEVQKLSELGQLTQENAAIINAWIKQMPKEIRDTMEATRAAALDDLERQMEKAVQAGQLPPPARDSTLQVFEEYAQQAADDLNLVNTTMLQSSVAQYQKAVILTQQEYEKLMRQAEATQGILNRAAGNVALGTETRLTAMRKAILQISDEGLTGFIDRAGRHWTPEAYVNMDIRTTVHNTAIQATKNRMQDYNTQVFQISSHAGARPLCYPYQGKFYSWDNTAGEIELGNGQRVRYNPISDTSYGEPAGIFGINCGHYPIPIIPGVTTPHGADAIQPEEENDKQYKESQQQRALERKIREAKRVVEMAGDAATQADKDKVKDLQAQMREFIDKTGRTRRYDREQVYGNKKPQGPPPVPKPEIQLPKPDTGSTQNPKPAASPDTVEPIVLPQFTPAQTREEAEKFALDNFVNLKQFGAVGVSYDGVDVGIANRVNKTIWDFYNEFNVEKFGGIVAPRGNTKEGKMIQGATAAYAPIRKSFFLNRKSLKTEAIADKGLREERKLAIDIITHPEKYNLSRMSELSRRVLNNSKTSMRTTVPLTVEQVLWHELGHSLERQIKDHPDYQNIKSRMPQYAEQISGYATTELSEYIAESFASWKSGETVADPVLIEAFISLWRKT